MKKTSVVIHQDRESKRTIIYVTDPWWPITRYTFDGHSIQRTTCLLVDIDRHVREAMELSEKERRIYYVGEDDVVRVMTLIELASFNDWVSRVCSVPGINMFN